MFSCAAGYFLAAALRAGAFFVAFLATRFTAFLAAVFLAVVFFAADFFAADVRLAAVFLAVVFFAADLRAVVFLAAVFFAVLLRAVVFFAAARLAGAFFAADLRAVVFFAAARFAGDFLAADFFAGLFAGAVIRCASSAAVVDESLRHCEQVDDERAPASTRRADIFRRVNRATQHVTSSAISKITLLSLRRKRFTYVIFV
jgi:hypothetical protein